MLPAQVSALNPMYWTISPLHDCNVDATKYDVSEYSWTTLNDSKLKFSSSKVILWKHCKRLRSTN